MRNLPIAHHRTFAAGVTGTLANVAVAGLGTGAGNTLLTAAGGLGTVAGIVLLIAATGRIGTER